MDGRGAAGYRLFRKRDRRRFRGSGPRPASTTFGGSTGACRADVKFTAERDLGRDHVALAAGFDAEHAEPALFVVERRRARRDRPQSMSRKSHPAAGSSSALAPAAALATGSA